VILVMLKEELFRGYYDANAQHNKGGEVAIIEAMTGVKISSVNTTHIGQTVPYMHAIDSQISYGSTRYTREDKDLQVMYYKLPKYDWVLVHEIPMQVYTNDTQSIRNTMILIVGVTVVIMAAFFSVWIVRYTGPIQNLMQVMKKVSEGQIDQRITVNTGVEELEQLNQQFNNMLDQVQFFMEVAEKKEHEKSLLEMQALQMQINPHFLYNTINSIRWMAVMNGAENVGDALVNLAELMNASFRGGAIIWTIDEELKFVKSYTKLMRIRYGTSVMFEIACEDTVKQYLIPKFIIQPILENSIKYRKVDGECLRIYVRIYEEEGIRIVVQDNGEGITTEKLAYIKKELAHQRMNQQTGYAEGIGLSNVNRRLGIYYEESYVLDVESHEGAGTQVNITIPKTQ
ncbi:MAG: sensor histidine kinase, partial [Cellulosilyticaceae bacterium]